MYRYSDKSFINRFLCLLIYKKIIIQKRKYNMYLYIIDIMLREIQIDLNRDPHKIPNKKCIDTVINHLLIDSYVFLYTRRS